MGCAESTLVLGQKYLNTIMKILPTPFGECVSQKNRTYGDGAVLTSVHEFLNYALCLKKILEPIFVWKKTRLDSSSYNTIRFINEPRHLANLVGERIYIYKGVIFFLLLMEISCKNPTLRATRCFLWNNLKT